MCTSKEAGQHCVSSRLFLCSRSSSPRCPFRTPCPLGPSHQKQNPAKPQTSMLFVLTSLLTSVTPQEPAGLARRAATALVGKRQERGGRPQPCPRRSWAGDHSPELKHGSTAQGLRCRARFHTDPFLMAVFHNVFVLFHFWGTTCNYCYIPFGTGKSEANTV